MDIPLNKSARVVWIDFCRMLGMFIVVFGHATDILPHDDGMSSFRGVVMPFYAFSYPCGIVLMFYFLSGLLQRSSAKYLDWGKFAFFMVPCVVWNVVDMMLSSQYPSTLPGYLSATGVIPDYKAMCPDLVAPVNYPMWFMTFLAYFSLIAPMVRRLSGAAVLLLLVVLVALASLESGAKPADGCHFYILREVQSFSVFVVGIIVSRIGVGKLTDLAGRGVWLGAVVLFLFSFHVFFPVRNPQGFNGVWAFIGVLAMCCYGMTAAVYMPRQASWLAQGGKSVFFAYAIHVPLFRLMARWLDLPVLPTLALVVYSAVLLAVCALVYPYLSFRVSWLDKYVLMKK